MLFLKFMPWRSGFQGEFPVCRVPLNGEWCPPKCIIPPPAVQDAGDPPLPGNWAAPHRLSPRAAPGEAALGQMVFSPWVIVQPCFSLCHPSDPPPRVDKPWENQPRWSCTNPVQLWFDPDPPAHLWMENKEMIDVLHVSLLLILLCKPPDTHLYLLGLPALLLRCTIVYFFS